MRRRFHRTEPRGPQIRINHRIRVPEVRVVASDGSMLGVMTTQDALRRAREEGLDLVEVNPKSMPPVCKILDFGKYKYEEKKRASDAKRRQTVVEVKELKLRPKTDDHDLNVKLRAARKFLESGNKVKFTVRFRGREITHPERAKMQLTWLLQGLDDLTTVEQMPTMEGRTMVLIVAPKPAVMQRVQAERAARERNAELRRARGEEPEEEPTDDDDEFDDDDDDDDDNSDDSDDGDEGDEPDAS